MGSNEDHCRDCGFAVEEAKGFAASRGCRCGNWWKRDCEPPSSQERGPAEIRLRNAIGRRQGFAGSALLAGGSRPDLRRPRRMIAVDTNILVYAHRRDSRVALRRPIA